MLAKTTFILFLLVSAVFSSTPQPIKAAEKVPEKVLDKATDKPVDKPAEQPVYSNAISILPGVVLVIRDQKGFTSRNTLLSRYVKNEIYQFKLSVFDPFLNNLPQLLEYQILFLFQDKTNEKRVFQCESKINFKTLNFETPCQFKLAGTFKAVILAKFPIFNKNEKSPVSFQLTQDFVIMEDLKIPAASTAVAPKAEGLAMQIFDNKLQFGWSSNAALTNITFTQTTKQKTAVKQYLLSNNQNFFEPDLADFNDFDLGEATVTISHALSKDGTFYQINSGFGQKMTLKFNVFPHQISNSMNFFRYRADPVFRQSYKEGETLQTKLIFDVNLGLFYYLLSPDNTVQKYPVPLPKDKQNELEQGVELPIKLELKISGAYMLTFVTSNGRNYINIPFYVGSGFPLLPRYSDINKKYYQTSQDRIEAISKLIRRTLTQQKLIEPVASSPRADKKAYLLKILNMFRNKYHASPLAEQKQLSQLAQVQAQNFIKNQSEKKKMQLPKAEVGGQFFYIHNSLTLALLEMEEQLSMLEPIVNKSVHNVGVGVVQIGKPETADFAHLIYLTFGKQSPEQNVKASDSKLPETPNIVSAATSNIRSQAVKQAAIKSL